MLLIEQTIDAATANANNRTACPTEPGPVARTEWKRVVPELLALKLFEHLDLAVVALYCSAYAGWLEATQAIQEFGPVIKTASGYPIQSPCVKVANHQHWS
jgi:P27 family predicted phage terminase small subunit